MARQTASIQKAEASIYSYWFLVPAFFIFVIFFVIPTAISLYFSMTVWSFDSSTFCGFDNYKMFFSEYALTIGIKNTFIYAFLTSGSKVVLAFLIAVFLTGKIRTRNVLRSIVFFPNLVSTVAVGIAFKAILHPTKGYINQFINLYGLSSVDWLGNRSLALFSVAAVDIWKGLSIATVIYVAGIASIDHSYYEASSIDGASRWQTLRYVTIPLTAASRNTVIILSLIGGLRSFELIWTMTAGGPGFASDVMPSIIYKQYTQGFFGLSTAGNVILLVMISIVIFPLQKLLSKSEEAMR
ncbi:MAG: carbohydrate ABC transporter permease [Candidatus Excrementavichristensenella sp.]|jgi:raffinose/stachyose/melibiose transport system permease protein